MKTKFIDLIKVGSTVVFKANIKNFKGEFSGTVKAVNNDTVVVSNDGEDMTIEPSHISKVISYK